MLVRRSRSVVLASFPLPLPLLPALSSGGRGRSPARVTQILTSIGRESRSASALARSGVLPFCLETARGEEVLTRPCASSLGLQAPSSSPCCVAGAPCPWVVRTSPLHLSSSSACCFRGRKRPKGNPPLPVRWAQERVSEWKPARHGQRHSRPRRPRSWGWEAKFLPGGTAFHGERSLSSFYCLVSGRGHFG